MPTQIPLIISFKLQTLKPSIHPVSPAREPCILIAVRNLYRWEGAVATYRSLTLPHVAKHVVTVELRCAMQFVSIEPHCIMQFVIVELRCAMQFVPIELHCIKQFVIVELRCAMQFVPVELCCIMQFVIAELRCTMQFVTTEL